MPDGRYSMALIGYPLRRMAFFCLFAFLFSLLNISKVFFIPHCMAFDMNDDANHTFINHQQWRRIISDGEWPMMNVYNNFGVPFLGDVITYPMSPLSFIYAFFPGPMGMTANRFLAGFFSLFLLLIFYRRRFSDGMSAFLALCTFYAPGFLWHSWHHHFQLSLLLLTTFFLLQERLAQRSSAKIHVGMCAVSIVMFLSVSFNVVVIMSFFIVGYQVFLSAGVGKRNIWLVLSALVCGAIAVSPDIVLFSEAASRSIRALAEYPVVAFEGANKIFWTPIIAATIYFVALFREGRSREGWLVLVLGVLPFVVVLLSRAFPALWKHIPLVGATDVMRLTWGANIFLMLGVGELLSRWSRGAAGWRREVFICVVMLGIDVYQTPFLKEWLLLGRGIPMAILGLTGVVFGIWSIGHIANRKGVTIPQYLSEFFAIQETTISRRMCGFVITFTTAMIFYYGFFVVLGFSYPYVCHVSGRGAFSRDGSEKFGPRKFVGVIPKNSRVAYDINTIHGLDLRGAEEGLFGAGARSTIMTNANFAVKLFNAKLVQFDNYTGDYHFCRPWQARELQRLGYLTWRRTRMTMPL